MYRLNLKSSSTFNFSSAGKFFIVGNASNDLNIERISFLNTTMVLKTVAAWTMMVKVKLSS
jgi:hypothetical protein